MPYPRTLAVSASRSMDTDMAHTLVEVRISVTKKQKTNNNNEFKRYGQYVAVLKLPHLYGWDKVVCLFQHRS